MGALDAIDTGVPALAQAGRGEVFGIKRGRNDVVLCAGVDHRLNELRIERRRIRDAVHLRNARRFELFAKNAPSGK